MSDYIARQSEDDFFKARNKALFNELQHFLSLEETRLLSFSEIKQMLKPKNEVYLGMQVIPVSLIVGSEGRYQDFDNHFFPKSMFLKKRWERIDQAHLQNIILPPIKLYEIGGLYFVRDGNHRVSVARSQGIECIDAEIVSLQSEIKLKPGMSHRQILKQVTEYEKRIFYCETAFGDITDCWNIDFTSPGQYNVIVNHIQIHWDFENSKLEKPLLKHEAILSWYTNVYMPVIQTIKQEKILRTFKKRTPADLYVWLIKYWEELKEKFGSSFSLNQAAENFKARYTGGFLQRLQNLFIKSKRNLDD